MGKAKFSDVVVCKEERFAIGVEEASGRLYVAIPVSNGLVDYEEYYEIDAEAFARYRDDPGSARDFVERCRQRLEDRRLILQPGPRRGSPA
ncbi:MAG: hypothetical protein KF889_12875 [Alphaproteobacteria bacterium]|nr:hypothetical protein [Alphaproteobacteria bacterium]MCW5739112.1 hypothetical protein [Alphaproteobacteria bacterium]